MRIKNLPILQILFFLSLVIDLHGQTTPEKSFRVIGFFTAQHDPAHISFVHEANKWFWEQGQKNNFQYDSTNDWSNLKADVLKKYDVVLFLDTRPEDSVQRAAFQTYMEQGGAWMGFHFAAFALTPSIYPQNWDWYHEKLLGSGQYKGNTWRPTRAKLKVELKHQATDGLPKIFQAAPNEWYSWQNDLAKNKDIRILLSIDSSSFPLGTGPKAHEIWHEGYYPVVWTNKKFNMLYFNMGHNDMDYGGTNKALSSSFSSEAQNKLIMNGLRWLAEKK
ncbi:ThuA domain-containing protein [Chryseolinea sp. H1M3-3]|uniref:ThuA domain-containing protein n=1 Tax=Chryseolinea sp. H1M3-3 TaxID=3034144 RepID=UPI0023EDC907|nr:ThuA domain-containing protein [Chryseolinea sp. H1M3-3]